MLESPPAFLSALELFEDHRQGVLGIEALQRVVEGQMDCPDCGTCSAHWRPYGPSNAGARGRIDLAQRLPETQCSIADCQPGSLSQTTLSQAREQLRPTDLRLPWAPS